MCDHDEFRVRVQRALKSGQDVNLTDVWGQTLLHYACREGLLDCVRVLLENKANVNNTDRIGQTPLHLACWDSSIECARALIDHKANVNANNGNAVSVLLHACYRHSARCVRLLLENKADIDAIDDDSHNVLMRVIDVGTSEECFRLLLNGTTNVNISDCSGRTVLHHACLLDSIKYVRLSLIAGVRIDLKDIWAQSALDLTYDEAIRQLMRQAENRIRQWQRICALTMWLRANYGHEFVYSGLWVIRLVMEFI